METFHHPIRLRVRGCCLAVLDVEQGAQGVHRKEVNWDPRSDVITVGTPNLLAHPRKKAFAHSTVEMAACGGGIRSNVRTKRGAVKYYCFAPVV